MNGRIENNRNDRGSDKLGFVSIASQTSAERSRESERSSCNDDGGSDVQQQQIGKGMITNGSLSVIRLLSTSSSSISNESTGSSSTEASTSSSSSPIITAGTRRSKIRRAQTTVYGPHDEHPYPQWHNAVAGGVAGAGARLATAPLDLIRIRRQLERNVTYPRPSLFTSLQQVYRDEGGISALFRGNMAATYLWIGYSVVQFSVYSRLKHYLEGKDHEDDNYANSMKYRSMSSDQTTTINPETQQFQLPRVPSSISTNPTAVAFLAGAGAGLCATISTYPFDICRTVFAARGVIPSPSITPQSPATKLVASTASAAATAATSATAEAATVVATRQVSFEPPKTVVECASAMYQQRGVAAFFAGIRPAVVQIVPYMGLNFAIYDSLTRGDRSIGLSAYAGSISGAISKLIVYPMDTVKKRLQAQSVFGPQINSCGRYYTGLWHCLTTMIQKEGVASLYRGIVPSVMKTTIGSGLTFSFFRMTKNGLEEMHDFLHYNQSSYGSRHVTSSSPSSRR